MVTVEVRKLPLNVVVLSRIPTFCADLCETLEGVEDIHVRTYATSPGEVFHAVRRYVVDLVVLDLRLKWTTICLVVSSLDRQSVPSLVVGDSINAARGLDLLRHGASAMLERHSSAETLVGNMRAVASANIRMSRGLQQSALRLIQASERRMTSVAWRTSEDSWVSGSDRIPSNGTAAADAEFHLELDHLTGREGEVVRAAMDGRTNQEIADSLGISVRTVKHHLTSVFRKSGVRNRTELVRASLVSSAQT